MRITHLRGVYPQFLGLGMLRQSSAEGFAGGRLYKMMVEHSVGRWTAALSVSFLSNASWLLFFLSAHTIRAPSVTLIPSKFA